MRLEVDRKVFDSMVRGSSVYSTGGGLELSVQLKMFRSVRSRPIVVSADQLDGRDYACAAYGVGSVTSGDFNPREPLRKGLGILEGLTGKHFCAVFAGETNIDSLVLSAASALGVPVLDADSTGGRAVPEMQLDNFFAAKRSILPLVAVNSDGESATVTSNRELHRIDRVIRGLATKSSRGAAAVLDHSISVADARRVLTTGIFSRSYEMGKAIPRLRQRADSAERMAGLIKGRIIARGRVTRIELKDFKKEGFLKGYYYIDDGRGRETKIFVKNENMVCWVNGRLAVSPPDPIMAIDSESLLGVHNTKIRKGAEVFVVAKKAVRLWYTPNGRKLFNLKKFEKDMW